jgi:CheY-like chemotaxis protein
VVDNHPMAIEVVEAVLSDEGYRVIPALSGEEGIRLAREEQPALVILDLLMPDLDGFDVLERLRADPATAEIPVVLLTSKTLSPEERARLSGRVACIAQKGEFNRAAFVTLVRSHAHPVPSPRMP